MRLTDSRSGNFDPHYFQRQYPSLKRSIVPIVSRVSHNPEFPDIIGTGFIVDEGGLIVTCKHVLDAIPKLPRRQDAHPEEWPACVYYLHFIPDKGVVPMPIDIIWATTARIGGMQYYYGTEMLDISVMRVRMTGLPALELPVEKIAYVEGAPIFTSGFPMGTKTLRAPGWLHQLTPTLQHGIISAVLPMPCDNPHALMIDCVTEGGASGSPLFDDAGSLLGMVFGGINETYTFQGDNRKVAYQVPTAHTLAVPAHLLRDVVLKVREGTLFQEPVPGARSVSDTLAEAERLGRLKIRTPRGADPALEPLPESKIEYPKGN